MTITATFDAAFDRIVAVPLCFRKFGGTIRSNDFILKLGDLYF